ncbi:hypothetical protein [Tomitella fengzijianii]|uniref:hypothetical protein n=1 Tax=Tomitella fengzijianii TaxID=2597660 RepID=UPI0018EF0AAA|nr:hypothetical protein [Tomitella fengzijianii]
MTTIDTAGPSAASIDSGHLRRVLGNFCTGVTVITAHDGVRPLLFFRGGYGSFASAGEHAGARA